MKKEYMGVPLEGFGEVVRKAAAEGMVLLKNENHMLPVTENDRVALFGRCQINYYKSGTGSGGAVNTAYTTNLVDGFREYKNITLNEELLQVYKAWIEENPFDNAGGAWASEPWFQKEMPVSLELAKKARETSNKALVVIGRTAGEDKDYEAVEGSYFLTQEEKKLLETVAEVFEDTAVILNVSNIIDMSWLESLEHKEHIRSVLYTWQGGVEAGRASADVLTGAVTPSGKLPDTIAYDIKDYPSTENFGNKEKNFYKEDIYVGYRYFETFAPEKVQFPFGFGLSYADFDLNVQQAEIQGTGKDAKMILKVSVTNVGTQYFGKEVVQVYYEAPQGKLGKPVRELGCFAKTELLAPGQEQILQLELPVNSMASYDDSGVTGHKSCYVLEAGCYKFYVGTDVRNAQKINLEKTEDFELPECVVTEELQEALAPTECFERIRPGEKGEHRVYTLMQEEVPLQTISLEKRIQENLPKTMEITGNKGISFQDVKNKKAELEQFVAQFTKEELSIIVRGEGMCSPLVTPGTASAFGGTAPSLSGYGIPVTCTADGPSGIRMDSGLKATQMPIGTMLAASWNLPMVEELYEWEGRELQRNEIDTLLGPGINLHRNPLNGRNFEYFSEDPYLTGKCGAAVVKGVKTSGADATVKHFACNNQELARSIADSIVSERAVREMYLKGFEMTVKEGHACSIMTSYNPLNGHWSASNYDLCTTILRGEWGYTGIVMTDWWAKMNDPVKGGEARMNNTAAMVRAQNDLYMVVPNGGSQENEYEDNTLEALENGTLTIGELQRCAMNICRFILHAPVSERKLKTLEEMQAENDNFAFAPIKLYPQKEETMTMQIEHAGRYKFLVKTRSPLSSLAQSSSNLLLNGQPILTIQSNGTENEWVILKLNNIQLEAGTYQAELTPVKPGLEVEWIEVTR
nr:glycoside hydrolase family 3 protein [uncultured Blautia sp.]